MDELDSYSQEEIDNMELQDTELSESSGCDPIETLATLRALYGLTMDPLFDVRNRASAANLAGKGLLMDDEWECLDCGERNTVESDHCVGCGRRKDPL